MLKVSVDLKQGIYIISENDGERIVTKSMVGGYDEKERKARIKALKNYPTSTPEEKSELLDFGLYDALQEFDQNYNTGYAKQYFDTTTKQIPFTGLSEKKKNYEKRATEVKAKEFAKAGINIQYNLSVFGGAKELSFGERLKAIRQAFKQKQNGVIVEFPNSKKAMLPAPSVNNSRPIKNEEPKLQEKKGIGGRIKNLFKGKQKLDDFEDDIPDMPDDKTLEAMKKEDEKINAKKAEGAQSIPTPEPNVPPVAPVAPIAPEIIENLTNPNQKNIDDMLATLKGQGIGNPENNIKPKDEPEEDLARAFEGRRVASEKRAPAGHQTPKKKISRSKSRQASKNAQREAGKLKNNYQERIDAKAKRKAEAEKRMAEGPKPKKVVTPPVQPPKPEPKPIQPVNPVPQQKPKRLIAFSKRGAKSQEGSFVTRFTRKIKDKTDSIRNKRFIPDLSPKQRKIAKATTLVAFAATLTIGAGIGTYKLASYFGGHTNNIENSSNIAQAVETVTPGQNVDKDGIDYILGIHDTGTKTPSEKPAESQAPDVKKPNVQTPSKDDNKPSTPAIEEDEKDSKKEYLSSIKVGTVLNINEGKYFETPEGTGNYGKFENFTEGVKRIEFIEVMTDEGYTLIKDDSVSVYELKQQYPNAKFAYHIVCTNKDGSERQLGWYTENSLDQNMDQQQTIVDIDDGER